MDDRELFTTLLDATNTQQVDVALATYIDANPGVGFQPVGRRPNNRGAIEVASDAGRSMIERVTNMLDALLELEHEKHGRPAARRVRPGAPGSASRRETVRSVGSLQQAAPGPGCAGGGSPRARRGHPVQAGLKARS